MSRLFALRFRIQPAACRLKVSRFSAEESDAHSTDKPAARPPAGRKTWCGLLILLLGLAWSETSHAARAGQFALHSGDRVVFLGDELTERAQAFGYLETVITKNDPSLDLTFRNLGWHVAPHDFWWPPTAEEAIKQQLAAFRPTVAVLGFGLTNAAAGKVDLKRLTNALSGLIRMVQEISPKARFVLMGPVDYAQRKRVWPTQENKDDPLFRVDAALKAFAAARSIRFVSLARAFGNEVRRICDQDHQLNRFGYLRVSEELGRGLGFEAHIWRIGIQRDGSVRQGSYGLTWRDVQRTNDHVKFFVRLTQVPTAPILESNKPVPTAAPPCLIQFRGLKAGTYTLKIDGQEVLTHPQFVWQMGLEIFSGPMFDQGEALRKAIIEKNKLVCALWRPDAVRDIFGPVDFELPPKGKQRARLQARVRALEKQIADLRRPKEHEFELVWIKGPKQGQLTPLLPSPTASPAPSKQTP